MFAGSYEPKYAAGAEEPWQWLSFYAVSPSCKSCQFSQQRVLLCEHTYYTHTPVTLCMGLVSLMSCWFWNCPLSLAHSDAWEVKEVSRLSPISVFMLDAGQWDHVSGPAVSCLCPWTQLMAETPPVQQKLMCSLSWRRCHFAALLVCHACSYPMHLKGAGGEEVVWLGEGRATVPIFHPVNKLQNRWILKQKSI